VPGLLKGQQVTVTLLLIALLGAIFLRGFTKAIEIAVAVVATYLTLNLVVVFAALERVSQNPHVVVDWRHLLTVSYASPLQMAAAGSLSSRGWRSACRASRPAWP
jgi:hypothetical protein